MINFKNSTLLIALISTLLFACNSSNQTTDQDDPVEEANQDKQLMLTKIDSLNKAMLEIYNSSGTPDIKTAMYAVQNYEYFAHDYPEDPLAGQYLMKAGEIYENVIHDRERAIRRYQSAFLHESEFETKPMALFRSANLYSELGDTSKAIKSFEMFIEKYPKHDFADDAEQMIKITRIGMDEFIKQAQQEVQ